MQTQTLKMPIPKGFKVDSYNDVEVILKDVPKNVMERIKTVADVLADNSWTQQDFDSWCKGLEPDEKAYRILKLLAKSLNEGWTPDWNDDDQWKYYPWFYMGGSSGFRLNGVGGWNSHSVVGSRLCFKTKGLAEHAVKHFLDVYKQFMLIN